MITTPIMGLDAVPATLHLPGAEDWSNLWLWSFGNLLKRFERQVRTKTL